MARVRGHTRNTVYRVTVPTCAYLKVFVDAVSDNCWARESAALDALLGTLPVPRLMGHRSRQDGDRRFMITSACPGQCFSGFLNSATKEGVRAVLHEIDMALRQLAIDARLRSALAGLPFQLIGSNAAGFSPAQWLDLNAPDLLPSARLPSRTEVVALHGSMGGDNIIVDASGSAPVLSALIDFEGCRIGPAGFDQAMLWYDLKLRDHHEAASDWLRIALRESTPGFLAGFMANAAWLSAVRSSRAHPEREQDRAMRAQVRHVLATLVRDFGTIMGK